jgi:multiple sugar transport system permease protein
VGPALLFLIVLGLVPGLYVMFLSIGRFTAGEGVELLGLDNYVRLARDARFFHSLLVTGALTTIGVAIQLSLGLILALALDRISHRMRRPAFTLIILPMLLTPVVIGILWRLLLRPRVGLVNYLLELVGVGRIPWFEQPTWSLATLIMVETWQWTPFLAAILLAGLQSQSDEVHEAARVDGAGPIQHFLRITLPLLRPIIALALALRVIDALKTFDLVYTLTRGGPATSTETVGYYTYIQGFTYFDVGLAAAMSVVQVVIVMIIARVLWSTTSGLRGSRARTVEP